MSIDELLRERGYWSVEVRPVEFREKRIAKSADLERILRACVVSLRGWDFPHVSSREPVTREADRIQQTTDWEEYLEHWSFFKSGLFLFKSGIRDDWRDRSSFWPPDTQWMAGARLGVEGVVYSLTEYLLFAARLASTDAGAERIAIDIGCSKISGRSLQVGNHRAPFFVRYVAKAASFSWTTEIGRSELVARAMGIAVDVALELFELFGWDPDRSLVESIQAELGRR